MAVGTTPIKAGGLLRSPRAIVVGLLAVVVVVAVVLIVSGRGGTYTTWASFDAVNGLVSDADVQAGGVTVGHVSKIALGDDGYPRVQMRLDDDFRLRTGAEAQVRFFSVGGEANRVIEITQGDGAFQPASAGIPRDHTDVPEEIDNVFSLLSAPTRNDVHALFGRLDKATTGRGTDIASALRFSGPAFSETSGVLAQLDDDGTALQQLVTQGRTTLAALDRQPGTVAGAIDQLGNLLSTTAARQQGIRGALAAAPASLRSADAAFARLDRSIGPLRSFVTDARPAFQELAVRAPDLRATLDAASPLLAQTRGLVGQSSDVHRLGGLLKTALPTLRDLKPALNTSLPMLGQLRARFPDAFAFISNWADFHSTYDAVGNSGRVGLIFTPTPTNEITGDQSGAGELKAPFLRDPGVLSGQPWTNYASTIPKPVAAP